MNRREQLAAPMHEMSRELIRERLKQFLPQAEKPAEGAEAPEESLSPEDVALLESTLTK